MAIITKETINSTRVKPDWHWCNFFGKEYINVVPAIRSGMDN
jgi:hypothetical protein